MWRLGKQDFPKCISRLVKMELAVNWQVVEAGGVLSGDRKYAGCMSTGAKAFRGGGLTLDEPPPGT